MYADIDRYGTYSLYEMILPEARTLVSALMLAKDTWEQRQALMNAIIGDKPMESLSNEEVEIITLNKTNIQNCERLLKALSTLNI